MADRLTDLLADDDKSSDSTTTRPHEITDPDNGDADHELDVVDSDEFGVPPRRGLRPITVILIGALLIAIAFTAGVYTQKHHDKGLTGSSASGGIPSGGIPSGFSAGGFGSPGGSTSTGTSGAGTGTGAGTGSTGGGGGTTTATPVVIGTVSAVQGNTVTVKDLGGKSHVVHTTAKTTITATLGNTKLKKGDNVSVYGSTTNGAVTATNITRR